jgi:hypothetical protein
VGAILICHDTISRTDVDDKYDDDKGDSGDEKERRRITTEEKFVCITDY